MNHGVKRIAVLGGGPAGAQSAERLARAGFEVSLYDEKLAWEKPCGGGLTFKAYNQYPFLIENDTPKKLVTETYLGTPRTGAARLKLTRPLVVYSRYELNRMLLKRAESAGADVRKVRVLGIERKHGGWIVRTRNENFVADYCIVATGARNNLREVGTEWVAGETMTALGYYIPCEQPHIDIQFFPNFEGYIWVFPRQGHLAAGICAKGVPAQALRTRFEQYLQEKDISRTGATFYAHVIPSLEKPSWARNRVAGEGWMAVGDAAGLVDPITGEGLYYSVRSADLASRVLASDAYSRAESGAAYRDLLRRDFLLDLEMAAGLGKRLYMGKFLYTSVTERMIQFMRRSPTFCGIMEDLFAGTQNYLDLKRRLMQSLHGTMHEVVMNRFLGQLAPTANRA